MSDKWNSYFCNVNDKLASVRVDLGIRGLVPDTTRPWLLWIWVYFTKPRPDGLSSSEEFPVLASIEEELTSMLSQRCGAILSGLITTAGHREFYFYGSQSGRFDDAVHDSLAQFQGYTVDLGKKQDPSWTQYLTVLYPSEEQLQLIGNRDVLDVLRSKGDKLQKARNVRHWAYFHSPADREAFRGTVQALGYRTVSQEENPQNDRGFGLCFERMQSMDPDAVDEAALELFKASKAANGEYDGWECEVITGPDTVN